MKSDRIKISENFFKTFCLSFLFFIIVSGCAVSKNPYQAKVELTAAVDAPSWDIVFQQTKGWTGADGINTADLLDGRVLWIFGDTWIGQVNEGRHCINSEIINNTIAVHQKPAISWMPPDPQHIKFYWEHRNNNNLSWIRPDHENKNVWFWPTGNGLVTKDSKGNFRLFFFMGEITRVPDVEGILSFNRTGNTLVIIENFYDDVINWRARKVHVPPLIPDSEKTGWGASLLLVPPRTTSEAEFIYIYGINEEHVQNKKLFLARTPAALAEKLETWECYKGNGLWGNIHTGCHFIADNLASEMSVELVIVEKKELFIMIHSEDGFGDRIMLRSAQSPEGPWSEPVSVYRVKDIKNNPKLVTYAAKSHSCISKPGELLISYVINSFDFEFASQNADIYRPRFIRLFLDQIDRP